MLPLFKKGSVDDPANHRPFYVKFIEVILKIQITDYFENCNLFYRSQHGVRSKLSTTLAIINLTDIINKGFEAKQFVHVQFLDLSKAFDCAPHDLLTKN